MCTVVDRYNILIQQAVHVDLNCMPLSLALNRMPVVTIRSCRHHRLGLRYTPAACAVGML